LTPTPNQHYSDLVPSHRGALRNVTDAGSGMRWTRAARLTGEPDADGKIVWSWRPDAGAKLAEAIPPVTGARKPGPRGERDISRKTIAWGMPDVSGASAVNTRVHTPTTKRTRGCGCIGHPAFPAPSDLQMAENSRSNLAQTCGEIAKLCLLFSLPALSRGQGWCKGSRTACPAPAPPRPWDSHKMPPVPHTQPDFKFTVTKVLYGRFAHPG
jgi:hypothetical protein